MLFKLRKIGQIFEDVFAEMEQVINKVSEISIAETQKKSKNHAP